MKNYQSKKEYGENKSAIMSPDDNWDDEMRTDASEGKLDKLLDDVENEYLAGHICFR